MNRNEEPQWLILRIIVGGILLGAICMCKKHFTPLEARASTPLCRAQSIVASLVDVTHKQKAKG